MTTSALQQRQQEQSELDSSNTQHLTNGFQKKKLSTKGYQKELKKLHVELVRLQEWVKHKGLKVCIVFEGHDGAGKGGVIRAITERASTRAFSHGRAAAAERTRQLSVQVH